MRRLMISGGLMLAGYGVVLALSDLQQHIAVYIPLYGGLWLLSVVAARAVWDAKPDARLLWLIAGGAVAFRLLMLFAPPSLSTDLFRYVWEGHVVSAGFSPYQYAPTSTALADLAAHDAIWPLVQQRDVPSPYPPLAQLLGLLEYQVFGATTFGAKFVAALADLGVCAIIAGLLRAMRLPPPRVVIYAWSPLPIMEFAQSGHNDAPMLLLLLLSVWLTLQKRPLWAALVLGLAALAKFTPLFALPLFGLAWYRSRHNSAALLLYPCATLSVVVIGYAPFLWLGGGSIGSILDYTSSWFDNESLFGLFYGTAHTVLPLAPAVSVAKAVSVLLLCGLLAALGFVPRLRERSLVWQLLVLFGAVLVVASTVHAWYVTWLLVFVPLALDQRPFDRFRFANIALIFSATVCLPYLSYNGTADYYSVRPLEYWPVYGYLLGYVGRCYFRKNF